MSYMTDENGNYKRTVRCGHCYQLGHNQGTCEKRKTDLAERIEHYAEELKAKNIESWRRDNLEHSLRCSKEDLHKMNNKGKNRKCGFCSTEGHTRRTCKDRKSATDIAASQTINLRKKTAQKMSDAGFGPGCLVETTIYGSDKIHLAIVTGVKFAQILPNHQVKKNNYFNSVDAVNLRYVTPIKDSWSDHLHETGCVNIPFEYVNIDNLCEEEWYGTSNQTVCKIISPVQIKIQQLLSPVHIDEKRVKQYVLEAVVDPR